MLVLHYTGMRSADAAIERLCDPAAKVSAHWLIEEDGRIWRLVPERRRAWHAGVSHWQGRSGLNDVAIGIELVNPGHEFGYRPFPAVQIRACIALCRDIVARHAIAPARVLAHSDIAPARKQDPGELFPWRELAEADVGLWPADVDVPDLDIAGLQRALARIGYDVPRSAVLDDDTRTVLVAFQRHYRPERVDGLPDAQTLARLAGLSARR